MDENADNVVGSDSERDFGGWRALFISCLKRSKGFFSAEEIDVLQLAGSRGAEPYRSRRI